MEQLYSFAEEIAELYGTRDPLELLGSMGAITRLSYEFDPAGLKGFATIQNGTMYAVINGHLNEYEKRIVAGHEAAHLLLHRDEIMNSPGRAMSDFDLFDDSGRFEHQANRFLADFLVSDEETLEVITQSEGDYFATAGMLHMPPALLAFKLHSMIGRGFKLRNPIDLKSNFLGA
ncbi:MAG: ImmA/IrrE family metallo-endopeptidase [Oscillospiraceae bacterium]|nr:ImmA/IrrE family metallo-endopeptidase [Oscillospiraceae bacterium]